MLRRREYLLGSIGAGLLTLGGRALAADDMVLAALKQAVGTRDKAAGMVAIIIDDSGSRMTTWGSSGAPNGVLNGDTVFEIMSNTKVLTSLLLADMVERGEVAFDDPVARYLPVTLREQGGPITLLDLATYSSGLPNMPANVPPDWYASAAPMAAYTQAQLFAFLSGHMPQYAPGTHYEYANLGFGLLGIALARRAGKPYEQLLVERVCNPLRLEDTRLTLSEDMQRRMAVGHDLGMNPTEPWELPAIPGAGYLRSTAHDLTRFIRACLGMTPTPLNAALARMTATQRPTRLAGTNAGLGWYVTAAQGGEIVWKSGLSMGCNTFMGYCRQRRRGVVLLGNFLWRPIDAGTIAMGVKLIDPISAAPISICCIRACSEMQPHASLRKNPVSIAKPVSIRFGGVSRRGALIGLASAVSACAAPGMRGPSGPIAEESAPSIGGIAQWVTIRGKDQANPAILFLHGGPGEAQSPFLPVFAPWEERYVMAQWDQRGSGRTFKTGGGLATPNMTFQQHVRDAIEVTQFVLRRLGISRLILVGHSWGSMVGLSAVRARPDLFQAFVGSGQVVNGRETAEGWRSSAIARAREANNAQAVSQLSGLTASDLGDLAKLDIVFRWQAPFIGPDRSYLGMQGEALARVAPPLIPADDYYRARLSCVGKLMPSVLEYDARTAGLDLPVPFFVIQGRDDNRTLPEAARAFVDQVRAPAKNYTAIEGGHFACFTNPSGFLGALGSDLRTVGIKSV